MSFLPEIQQVETKLERLGTAVRTEVLAYSEDGDLRFPIHKISFGTDKPDAPVVGFIGGVHGLERIGSQVCVALLNCLSELAMWDKGTQKVLEDVRVFFIPTVNPIGIYRKKRANPNGVDLMRNAPIDADDPPRLLGGHRISPRLPWYRGVQGAPMEVEAQALIRGVQQEMSESRLAITIDLHSGFGFQDRIWFPYAGSIKPFKEISLMYSLNQLFERTYPQHFYRVEPQAGTYTIHGDLWDYLYEQHRGVERGKQFLPLCLEMGSWMWLKKNPWQIFRPDGPFNPLIGHRHKRTLRRHITLMEFLIRAVHSSDQWAQISPQVSTEYAKKAQELWYDKY